MDTTSIKLTTVQGWIRELDPEGQWLCYSIISDRLVQEVHCSLCRKHEMQIRSLRNYSANYVKGVRGAALKKDGLRKHATSEQHLKAHTIEYPVNVTDRPLQSTPVEQALATREDFGRNGVAKLIDIAYLVAKTGIPFARFEDIVELEGRHGVNLGKTDHNDKMFHELLFSVNETMVTDLKITLGISEFFSFFSDGCTDSGAVKKELVVLQHLQELMESGPTSFMGEDLSKLIKQCEEYDHTTTADPESESKVLFRGHELQQVNIGLEYFQNHVEKYVSDVEKCISDRFSDLDTGLLKCSKLLDTRLWPMSEESFTLSYGNDDIKKAATHFHELILKHISPNGKPIQTCSQTYESEFALVHRSKRRKSSRSTESLILALDGDSEVDYKLHQQLQAMQTEEDQAYQPDLDLLLSGTLIEWGEFKCHVLENMSHFVKSPEDVWSRLHAMYDASFPRLKLLIQCLRVIPLSNAIVEKCFLTVTKTNTNWRASLGELSLEALVRIKNEGPPLAKFDNTEAVKMFQRCFSIPRRSDDEKV
ncbi:uncharacterized protein LOC144019423 isoform X2 [Festucalex cinctus]